MMMDWDTSYGNRLFSSLSFEGIICLVVPRPGLWYAREGSDGGAKKLLCFIKEDVGSIG